MGGNLSNPAPATPNDSHEIPQPPGPLIISRSVIELEVDKAADANPGREPRPFSGVPNTPWPPSSSVVVQRYRGPLPPEHVQHDLAAEHHVQAKLRDFPVLDDLAIKIIKLFAGSSLAAIRGFNADAYQEKAREYRHIRHLFHIHLRGYAEASGFIEQNVTRHCSLAQQESIRKTNKAAFLIKFCDAISGGTGLIHLYHHFLETFVAPGQRLLLWHGHMLMELKTQVYIAQLTRLEPCDVTATACAELLEDLFPDGLGRDIVERHQDTPSLASAEVDFVERARLRKQYLLAEPAETAAVRLAARYNWQDFVKEFVMYISKNVDSILNAPGQAIAARHITSRRGSHTEASDNRDGLRRRPSIQNVDRVQSTPHLTWRRNSMHGRATAEAPVHSGNALHDWSGENDPGEVAKAGPLDPSTDARSTESSTLVRDSKAHVSTSSPCPYSRQSWAEEEEHALLAGLNRVGGPFWSQILSLYGRGGSVSEVLKNRNQVQLKDKARNMKLCHLKNNGNDPEKIPPCLRSVTGELRKRGGVKTRAACATEDHATGGHLSPPGIVMHATEARYQQRSYPPPMNREGHFGEAPFSGPSRQPRLMETATIDGLRTSVQAQMSQPRDRDSSPHDRSPKRRRLSTYR